MPLDELKRWIEAPEALKYIYTVVKERQRYIHHVRREAVKITLPSVARVKTRGIKVR